MLFRVALPDGFALFEERGEALLEVGSAANTGTLEHGALQAWRERVWFAGTGLDPDARALPSIDAMLRGAGRPAAEAKSNP
jgi:hypothetical protein